MNDKIILGILLLLIVVMFCALIFALFASFNFANKARETIVEPEPEPVDEEEEFRQLQDRYMIWRINNGKPIDDLLERYVDDPDDPIDHSR